MFDNKTLLITGGTGTFGNAVLRGSSTTDIAEIRIFSRDEKKQEDMRLGYANPKLKFYIGDVRDYDSVAAALDGVDYVFHAAALKQVPSCEFYPLEALRTNALGAENVLNAAIDRGVERAIVLSTDKAVYPINAMGISKAMMEKLMVAKARLAQARRHDPVRHPLRQRHGVARFGHPALHPAGQGRPAAHRHRSEHDAVHDVDRRRGRPGAVCLPARRARRHLRAEGAGRDDRDAGARDQDSCSRRPIPSG